MLFRSAGAAVGRVQLVDAELRAMGVAGQVTHGQDGFLVDPQAADADEVFGHHVEQLLTKQGLRTEMSAKAVSNAHDRSDPEVCVQRYLEVFEVAKDPLFAQIGRASCRERVCLLV